MNVSLQAFPFAPWVLHENHVETSQSNAVKGSPRVIGKQEVQMHRHKTLMNEPELQARAVPSSDRANHEFNISPGAPSHVAPRSSQVQIQNDWKSASKGSEKGEKKKQTQEERQWRMTMDLQMKARSLNCWTRAEEVIVKTGWMAMPGSWWSVVWGLLVGQHLAVCPKVNTGHSHIQHLLKWHEFYIVSKCDDARFRSGSCVCWTTQC